MELYSTEFRCLEGPQLMIMFVVYMAAMWLGNMEIRSLFFIAMKRCPQKNMMQQRGAAGRAGATLTF